ncbi:MAG: glyoxalase [Chloroflexota bacterium]
MTGPVRPGGAAAIHHVQVAMPAGGEDQPRGFYRTILGLREIEKPANLRGRGGVWFQSGTLQLHLGVEPGFHPAAKAHVAYEVPNPTEMRARLLDTGHLIVEDERLAGHNRFYTADPFGNRVEILGAI